MMRRLVKRNLENYLRKGNILRAQPVGSHSRDVAIIYARSSVGVCLQLFMPAASLYG